MNVYNDISKIGSLTSLRQPSQNFEKNAKTILGKILGPNVVVFLIHRQFQLTS